MNSLLFPLRDYVRIEDLIIQMAEKETALYKHFSELYKDDYIIRILDLHRNNRYGFVKLYPTGIISLHMFRKEPPEPVITFRLDTALFEEVKYFAKVYINNHYDISRNAYVVDDRCFFDGSVQFLFGFSRRMASSSSV